MLDWKQLLDDHGAALVLYARQWCNSHDEAEDAVQEGFLRMHRSKPEKINNPVPYLYKAVRWAALDRLRSDNRRSVREEKAGEILYEETPMFQDGLVADEQKQAIEKALAKIPPEQREVLVMKIWGGQTFKNIGEALDISLNTAAARYRYALAALRKNLPAEAGYAG